jgi:hypothetical protein
MTHGPRALLWAILVCPFGAEEHSLKTLRELPEFYLETAETRDFLRLKGAI